MKKIIQTNTENIGIIWDGVSIFQEGYSHTDALWFEEDKHNTYLPLAKEIYEKIIKPNNIKSILELGAGAGSLSYWIRHLSNEEVIIVTLDGNKETVNSPYINKDFNFIVKTNEPYYLVDENNNTVIFDLVLSFEHFEHIPAQTFSIFLQNIKNHISKNTLILATASLQGGDLEWHPNIKSREDWVNYLTSEGFQILNSNFIKPDNVPFNFPAELTNELFFKLK